MQESNANSPDWSVRHHCKYTDMSGIREITQHDCACCDTEVYTFGVTD